jgi:carbamate kinase
MKMKAYKDITGKSGVLAYEIRADQLYVLFKTEPEVIYVYNYDKPGKRHLDEMKKLAVNGKGLSTYISVNVRGNFACKLEPQAK